MILIKSTKINIEDTLAHLEKYYPSQPQNIKNNNEENTKSSNQLISNSTEELPPWPLLGISHLFYLIYIQDFKYENFFTSKIKQIDLFTILKLVKPLIVSSDPKEVTEISYSKGMTLLFFGLLQTKGESFDAKIFEENKTQFVEIFKLIANNLLGCRSQEEFSSLKGLFEHFFSLFKVEVAIPFILDLIVSTPFQMILALLISLLQFALTVILREHFLNQKSFDDHLFNRLLSTCSFLLNMKDKPDVENWIDFIMSVANFYRFLLTIDLQNDHFFGFWKKQFHEEIQLIFFEPLFKNIPITINDLKEDIKIAKESEKDHLLAIQAKFDLLLSTVQMLSDFIKENIDNIFN
ncbi:glomulin [Anaeramoeba ignava]|uniref:Glomulin n=1 Tax=Anaeramoeba ignava TaxID=1746090 RepID=A0A9Q0RAT0_ANAIG|nr:glomulin [Anaeramoeba ignava]